MTERAWIDTSGNERLRGTIEPDPGGSLPDPVTDPVNIALDADAVALSVTAAPGGGDNLVEITPDNPDAAIAVDGFGRFVSKVFTFLGIGAGNSFSMSLPATSLFRIDNDDTGDPILKVAAGTPNTVEINGVPYSGNGFPVSLGDGDFVSIASATTPTTQFVFQRGGAQLQMSLRLADVEVFRIATDGTMLSTSAAPFVLLAAPVVPAIPTPQDIVDALKTLGLVTQA